jgi:uncharacterized protein YqhQ
MVERGKGQEFDYGGQAVMEGVMMRGRRSMAVAVRHPSGRIVIHNESLKSPLYTSRWWRLPFLRGLVVLWDTLGLGMRSLIYSANVALEEEEVEFRGPAVWGLVFVSLAFAIAIFFLVPLLLVGLIDRFITSALVSNLIEGVLRLGLFLSYIWLIGLLPDIRRFFAYHGAEHKTINAYEAGAPLDPASVAGYATAHARCGTGFLLFVLVLSILVFALLGRPPFILRILSRLLLIPLIVSPVYEFIKFAAHHQDNPLLRALVSPGLALQSLTTREPDEGMLEVAIAALESVLAAKEEG